jgi:hypothetical protein
MDIDQGNISYPYTEKADPNWIAAAIKAGFTGTSLTREQCIIIHRQSGLGLPRWLMKDSSRRLSRGVYACPELDQTAYMNKVVDDFVDGL